MSRPAFTSRPLRIAIIGAGPAGLAAAECLGQTGEHADIYEAMPSPGRKFLMAGRGGLNLTHSEPLATFVERYGEASPHFTPWLKEDGPDSLRAWANSLGVDTFVGSSGRVFPREMKAAPLLRAWLRRLREQGHRLHVRHRWLGWSNDNLLLFDTPSGVQHIEADVVILALGGGSWPQLGSTGAWVHSLVAKGIAVRPLLASNCGYEVTWSDHFRDRFAGQPLKNVAASVDGLVWRRGECMLSANGIEGGLIYALSLPLRTLWQAQGRVELYLDLLPDHMAQQVASALAKPRGRRSLASHLSSTLGISGARFSLLREVLAETELQDNAVLATKLKALPLPLKQPRPIEEAISTAGGVDFAALDEHLMLKAMPGIFCAGEMLDWDAPTGGYLLTGCIASGRAAARGVLHWLKNGHP